MGAPGYDVELLPKGAVEAGAAVLAREWPEANSTPAKVIRRFRLAIAGAMLAGMGADGWTFTSPPAGHVARPAYDPDPPKEATDG